MSQPTAPDTLASRRPATGERDTQEFPEGGRGWLVVAGTWVIMATSFGLVSAYGVYQSHYLEQYPSTSQSVLTMVGSLQPFMIYISGAPAVALIKKWGAQVVVAISGVVLVLSLMMIPLCNSVWQLFLAQGVLYGFGSGLGVFVSYSVPQQWFKRKRAMAVGLAASGSSVGGLVWPIVFQALYARVGWEWTNRIMGFMCIPLMAFAAFATKERDVSIPADPAIVEDTNQLGPITEERDLEGHPHPGFHKELHEKQAGAVYQSDVSSPSTTSTPPPKSRNPFGFLQWSVLKDYHFTLIVVVNFIVFFGIFPPLFFLPSYAARINTTPQVAKYAITICNSASVLGRILPGFIGDRIGRVNTLIPSIFLAGVCQLAFWLPAHSDALLIVFALAFGYSSGAMVSLLPACLGQLFGIHSLQSRLCIMFLFGAPSAFAGPAICGLFLPLPSEPGIHGYNKLIIFSGVVTMAGAGLLTYCRFSITKKLFTFV